MSNAKANNPSPLPESYREQLPSADTTGRFDLLEQPANDARRELRKETIRLGAIIQRANAIQADVLGRNLSAHERYARRMQDWADYLNQRPTRALIVEDYAGFRVVLREWLRDMGFITIHEATDFRSARNLVQSEQYDLVLVDVRLSHGDVGFDVVDLIRHDSLKPRVPVLVMSGVWPDDDVDKLVDSDLERFSDVAGASDSWVKSEDFGEFEHRVRELLRKAKPRIKLKRK